MIVCHCQSISDRDIHAAIDWMRQADPDVVITAGRIYRALGKRADCGGCMPFFLATMRKSPNLGHRGPLPDEVPAALRGLRQPARA